MQITPIGFNGITPPNGLENVAKKIGIMFKTFDTPRLTFLGETVNHVSVGRYGQIQPGGYRHGWMDDWRIHDTMGEYKLPLLWPFGEPMIIGTCGNEVYFWEQGNRYIMSFQVKNEKSTHRLIYQVHFKLDEPGVVEYHYYSVNTGFSTMVGATKGGNDYVQYGDFKENWPYHKVALRVDTRDGEHPVPAPDDDDHVYVGIPDGEDNSTGEPPLPDAGELPFEEGGSIWQVVYEDSNTKLLRK